MKKKYMVETTEGSTNVIGTSFGIEDGYLKVLSGADVMAVFAAGSWISIQVVKVFE